MIQCEKTNLELAKESLLKVQDDASKHRAEFGVDSILIEDLNQENQKVKDLSEDFNNVSTPLLSWSREQRTSLTEDTRP